MMALLLEFLATPLFLYITIALLGALIGSFLNVVIYRLPLILKREWMLECAALQNDSPPPAPAFNLMWPPSHCPACKEHIHWWHNIPLISYILLRGECRFCQENIPARYPMIELLTMLASLFVAMHTGLSASLLPGLIFTWILITAAFIDIDEKLLPDDLTLLGLWIGLLISTQHIFLSPTEAIIGAACGYLSLWVVYWVFKLLTKKEGMGYGDFKLMACVGAWLGFEMLPIVILLSSLLGTLYGVVGLIFRDYHRDHPIPFGPFIALSAWVCWIFEGKILHYFGL